MGCTTIENQEYKDLILKEKELEDVKNQLKQKEIENTEAKNLCKKIEEELKELILVITDNKTSFHKKIEYYDIEDNKLAKYLSENYYIEGKLEYRKQKIEDKEKK